MTSSVAGARPWLISAAAYLAVTVVYWWRLLPVMSDALPGDLGDPALNSWILWWNSQAVPFTARWWNAPIFYPETGAFALSETLIAAAPFTTPLLWLGASPVFAYNALLIVSYPLTALASHALAYRLTGRHDAAFLAGLAFGFNPYRAGQISHIQMMLAFWLPIALLALHRLADTGRVRWAALASVCWVGAGLSTGYYLVYFAILIAFWMAFFARSRRTWIVALTAFALGAVAIAPILLKYRQEQHALGLSRHAGEIETFSADLTAIWSASERGGMVASQWTFTPKAEGELYPGVVILLLTIVGAVVAWRAHPPGPSSRIRTGLLVGGLLAIGVAVSSWLFGGWELGPLSVNRPHRPVGVGLWLLALWLAFDGRMVGGFRRRSPFFFYAMAAGVLLLFAMGPYPRAFGHRFMYQAPYAWLMQLPGGDALRVPVRFWMLISLCLSPADAIAFVRVVPVRAARGVIVVLAAVVAIDGFMPTLEMPRIVPPLEMAGQPPDAIVLELPINHHQADTKAMLRATEHGRPIFNGYSGYSPPHFGLLAESLTEHIDPDVMRMLQRFGPLLILVSRNEGVFEEYRDLMDAYPDAVRAGQTQAGIMYRLPQLPWPDLDPSAPRLPIASADVSSRHANASLMLDEDITTRWETSGPQSAGDEVVVRLASPATVSRIEMDLGEWHGDYPRGLRIDLVPTVGDRVTVWDEPTTGETILAMIEDSARTPIVLPLVGGPPVREIRLTVTGGHQDMSWSIGELRLYGRPSR